MLELLGLVVWLRYENYLSFSLSVVFGFLHQLGYINLLHALVYNYWTQKRYKIDIIYSDRLRAVASWCLVSWKSTQHSQRHAECLWLRTFHRFSICLWPLSSRLLNRQIISNLTFHYRASCNNIQFTCASIVTSAKLNITIEHWWNRIESWNTDSFGDDNIVNLFIVFVINNWLALWKK